MKIYLDGLERSGNLFLVQALSGATGVFVESQKTHILDVLKNHQDEYPFVVPVRDALPSMVSSKIYRDHFALVNSDVHNVTQNSSLQEIINRYSEYIQYLLEHPKFFIAPFHEFTKDHNKVIDLIIKSYPGLTRIKTSTADQVMLHAFKSNQHAYDTRLGNFPRESAENKSQIEHLFLTNHYQEILDIQDNMDKLYKRYYDLERCYNNYMTTDIQLGDNPNQCCTSCVCENLHRSKPEE